VGIVDWQPHSTVDDLPEQYAGLAAWLQTRGYECTRNEVSPRFFGNRLVDFVGSGVCVRFLLDRLVWETQIGFAEDDDRFSLDFWILMLEGRVAAEQRPDADAAFVRKWLADIEERVSQREVTKAQLLRGNRSVRAVLEGLLGFLRKRD
jgi:hypothetical protein